MLFKTTWSFSFETRPDKAFDASTRIRKLVWTEHLLMNGMNRNGSKASPDWFEIGDGLSLDKSISIGHKLGCTTFFRLDADCSDEATESNSVATLSSLKKNECSAGYLQSKEKETSQTRAVFLYVLINSWNISLNSWHLLLICLTREPRVTTLFFSFNTFQIWHMERGTCVSMERSEKDNIS